MRKTYLYIFSEIIFFEKFEISKLVKCFRRWKVTNFFLFDETFNRRNITPTNFSPIRYLISKVKNVATGEILSEFELKFSKTFIGQFLKGNNSTGPIKMHNGGNYAHAQDYNAYNFC